MAVEHNDRTHQDSHENGLFRVMVFVVAGLAALVTLVTFGRIYTLITGDGDPQIAYYINLDSAVTTPTTPGQQWVELSPEQAEAFRTAEMDAALHKIEVLRAESEDAVNSAQLVLSFLEGAGFLIALAAGIAAIYGFRSAREVRTELHLEKKEMQDEFRSQMTRFEIIQNTLDDHREDLESLPRRLERVAELEKDLHEIPEFFLYLLQAYHELQLRNHDSAYAAVMQALKLEPHNPMALYYAGWLELQYIPRKIDLGMEHLQEAYMIDPQWPSAEAAYGVVLRRQAMAAHLTESEREQLFNKAEGKLRSALGASPMLLDLNRESLWGPVAGIQRDRERVKPEAERDYRNAIETYETAAKVTPGSSYPRGNLSALYMWRYKRNSDREDYEKQALDSFEDTVKLAQAELALEPSDYYHVMDIVMAKTVLSQQRPEKHTLQEAADATLEALAMNPTPEMLRVSARGWDRLLESCPDHWHDLREQLKAAIRRFNEVLAEGETKTNDVETES